MARVPLIEVVFKATSPATLVSGSTIYVYERGTTTEAVVYSAESGGDLLEQPLTTDDAGHVEKDGQVGWVEAGSYDFKVDGEDPVPRELPKGGAGGEIVVNRIGDELSAPRLDAPVNIWIAKGQPENETAEDIVIDEDGLSMEDIDGLGDAAGLDVGTTVGTVAAGDDSRITGAQQKSEKGEANGYASLDSGGKVPVTQLPNAIMEYQGTWNASTNSPALEDGKGSAGDVYRVSVAGERNLGSGTISFEVGDYAVYNGSVWEKSDTTDAVASVAGKTGVVKLSFGDIEGSVAEAQIAEEAISESRIKALAVTAAKVAANAIEAAKIKAEAVTEGKIANLAVTAAKLAAEAVETAKIKAEAVTTEKLANLAVTAAKLAANAVTASKVGDLGLGPIFAATNYTERCWVQYPGSESYVLHPGEDPPCDQTDGDHL